jgi:hypothetical protein
MSLDPHIRAFAQAMRHQVAAMERLCWQMGEGRSDIRYTPDEIATMAEEVSAMLTALAQWLRDDRVPQ